MFSEPILHVDMDAFFVEVERLRNPRLVGRPVVVGGAGARSVVAAASYEARQFGVRSAMPMSEARRRCHDLTIVPPDHAQYSLVSEQVFGVFRRFTPLVEGLSIDEAFLDVSGLRLHQPSPASVGEEIRSVVRHELGLPASVGVAASKFVAKLASQDAKPDGLLVVTSERQGTYLSALPVGRMWGVGAATGATLARLGVATIGDLVSIGESTLERELGPSLAAHLSRLARGEDPRPVEPDSTVKSVSAEETYETDLRGLVSVVASLRTPAERVGRRLRRSGLRGRTVWIKIRYDDFTTLTRSETLTEPTDTGAVIFEVAARLASAVIDRGRPVRLSGVGVSGLASASEPLQLTVEGDDRRRSLDEVMDAVRDRFGSDSVEPGAIRFVNRRSDEKSDEADQ